MGRCLRSTPWLLLGLLLWAEPSLAQVRCAATDVAQAEGFVRQGLRGCDRGEPAAATPPCLAAPIRAMRALTAPICEGGADLSAAEKGCQEKIAQVAGEYFSARLAEISRGQRATSHARDIDRIVEACPGLRIRKLGEAETSGVVPRLGSPCEAIGGAPGDVFDARRAALCLRGTLSRLANDAAPKPLRPNFVVVLTDDQRWDTTPAMPRLNEEIARFGATYTNAFVNTPLCAPSRAGFLSGRYASANGVRVNRAAADSFEEALSIANRLQAAGYQTGLFGIYLADLGTRAPSGWNEWYALRGFEPAEEGVFPALHFGYPGGEETLPPSPFDVVTDRLAGKAEAFVDANAQRPFLLWLGLLAPHQPALPARRHAESFADLPPWRPASWQEEDVSDKPSWVRFLKAISKPGSAARVDALRLGQMRSLLAVDDAVGALSERLEALGLTDDTVFVFASDNGHLWGEHWLSSKFATYEEAIRVPLIVRYPRLGAYPRSNSDLALNVDLAWTFADLAGLPARSQGPGRSLVPTLRGEALGRREVFLESPGGLIARPSFALRTERWKYIETDAEAGVTEELYDLEADPLEMENLAGRSGHRPMQADLARRLGAWKQGTASAPAGAGRGDEAR